MDGLHSPWGMIGRIKDERGYTHDQVLWDTSWLNLLIEMADAPRWVKNQAPEAQNINEVKRLLGRN